MLAHVSKRSHSVFEDVEADFALVSDDERPMDSVLCGHPFQIRGLLQDGTQVSVALSKTECAQLYVLFRNDGDIRVWADKLEALATLDDSVIYATSEH